MDFVDKIGFFVYLFFGCRCHEHVLADEDLDTSFCISWNRLLQPVPIFIGIAIRLSSRTLASFYEKVAVFFWYLWRGKNSQDFVFQIPSKEGVLQDFQMPQANIWNNGGLTAAYT